MSYCMNCMNPIDGSTPCPHCGFNGTTAATPHHLPAGTILGSRYLIGCAIGEGGFGITYIGRDLKLDMRIAVKEYYPSGFANRNAGFSTDITISNESQKEFLNNGKSKFLNEARVLASFSGQPGIVDVRDYFEANNTAYIVMEYLDGLTLKEYEKNHPLFSADEIFTLMDPLLDALEKIHEKGVIHRDISPDNIMLLKNGTLKLMDFGAARAVGFETQKSLSILLKPGYAPEEQYRSRGLQGPWTDLYALCATIYKCITGKTPDDALQRAYYDELKRPSELGIPISARQETALMAGLIVKQADRCQNIGEFRALLSGSEQQEKTRNLDLSRVDSTLPAEEDPDKTVYMEPPVKSHRQWSPNLEEHSPADNIISSESTDPLPEDSDRTVYMDPPIKQAKIIRPAAPEPAADHKNESENSLHAKQDSAQKEQDQKPASDQPENRPPVVHSNISVKDNNAKKETEPKEPVSQTSEKQTHTKKKSADSHEINVLPPENSPQKQKRKRRVTVAIISTAATVAVIFLMVGLWYFFQSSKVTIGDTTYSVRNNAPVIHDITLTDTSLELLTKFKQPVSLTFNNCKFEGDPAKLSELKTVKTLTMDSCSGIQDYSFLKDLPALKTLTITNSDFGSQPLTFTLSGLDRATFTGCGSLQDLSFLSSCTQLYSLDLQGCGIKDLTPLQSCQNLEILNLNQNPLSGDLSSLSYFSSLRKLYIESCGVSDLSPLISCEKLEVLNASQNQISNISSILTLQNLLELDLSENQISDFVGSCESLRLQKLYLNDNQLSSSGPLYTFSNLTQLTHLDLSHNSNLLDEQLALKLFTNNAETLTHCALDGIELSSINFLASCISLEELSIRDNHIKDISALDAMSNLKKFYADNNEIQFIDSLKGLDQLEIISLSHNQISDISPLDNNYEKEIKLDLSYNSIQSFENWENSVTCRTLLLYGNESLDSYCLSSFKGSKLGLTYQESYNPEDFQGFSEYYIENVPDDRKVYFEDTLGKYTLTYGKIDLDGTVTKES